MSNEVTQILVRIEDGDHAAIDELLPKVYEELRIMARAQMNQERLGHTLQPTALVNEAYLRLVNPKSPLRWESRGHFFASAAEAMRRILVDHARKLLRQRRGGDHQRVDFPSHLPDYRLTPEQMLLFSDAIDRLAEADPRKAELVKLRCFAGLDREQLSNALGISLATVDRYWAFAKVWLYEELTERKFSSDDHEPDNEPDAQ